MENLRNKFIVPKRNCPCEKLPGGTVPRWDECVVPWWHGAPGHGAACAAAACDFAPLMLSSLSTSHLITFPATTSSYIITLWPQKLLLNHLSMTLLPCYFICNLWLIFRNDIIKQDTVSHSKRKNNISRWVRDLKQKVRGILKTLR